MKKVSKLLSVVLSLVLCLSMVAPAFAAVDAYYYVEITNAKNPPVEIDTSTPGTGSNGDWVFMGQGTVTDKIAADAPLNDQGAGAADKNPPAQLNNGGKLPEGFTAPEAGTEQIFTGGQYYEWVDKGDSEQAGANVDTAIVKAFHDIGQYQYDDETADEAAGKFTYTVVWDSVGKCTNSDAEDRGGFDFDGSECASVTVKGSESTDAPDAGRICFGGETIHVNGKATLHQNAEVKIVVKDYTDGGHKEREDTETDTKYIREGQENNQEAVKKVANQISGLDETVKDLYDFSSETNEDGTVTATYTEQTYTVSYEIQNGADVDLDWTDVLNALNSGSTKGKASENWESIRDEMLKAVVTLPTTGSGTYTISDWDAEPDGNGGYRIVAKCSYTPNRPTPPTPPTPPATTIIDEPEVPLAGLFTRADAIGYRWEQAGSPDAELSTFEDMSEDHQWAVAIGWAQDNGIAVADLEGNFRPDDLVLRSVESIELSPEGELEQFLNRYAVYAGINLAEGELFIELAGEWDDVIMGEDAQVIFDDFFVKLELALAQAA